MLDMSRFLKFEMISLIKAVSWLLLRGIESFEVRMTSSNMGMLMERGAWSEDKQFSGCME